MDMRPWRLSSSTLKALQCLDMLADATETWVERIEVEGVARGDMYGFLRDLETRGRVELQSRRVMSMAQAYPGARLTAPGEAYVEEMRRQREDRFARARACRTELLEWLYDHGVGHPVTTKVLEQDPAPTYFGEPFTEEDVTLAARHLYESDLIAGGLSSHSNGAPLRSNLTLSGRRCVEEYNADATQMMQPHLPAAPRVPTYVQHNYQPSGSVAQGERAQAVTHQGLSPQELESLLAIFARGLEGVTDVRDREDVQDAIEDLRADLSVEVVEPQRVERRLRGLNRVAERVGSAMLTTATNDGTRRVMEWLSSLT
jgi:hypothetical protein